MQTQLYERPLGTTVPDSAHAVCCSLPTLAAVIGYEERVPQIMAQLQSGYPRFVTHPLVARALEHIATVDAEFAGRRLYALPSQAAAKYFLQWLRPQTQALVKPVADFYVVALPEGTATLPATHALCRRARSFLQHTGLCISSRQAEAYLVTTGLIDEPQPEVRYLGASAEAYILAHLRDWIASPDIHLCSSGMNAFYGALQAVRQVQAPTGRTHYLQLGWLYLDTQCILEKFLDSGDTRHIQFDVFDKQALEAYFAEHGSKIAALVTELPTNPLIQTPDVQWLSDLCARYGVVRIYDPTVAGIANVDVLPHCDILVTSLTKYAASQGDVMLGALALNPASPFAEALRPHLAVAIEPPYAGDSERLAAQIGDMADVCDRQNTNAIALAAWLEQQPQVSRVHHPRSDASGAHFDQIARGESNVGAMLTIELNGDLAAFYDNTPLVKGPSFGTVFSMMCPFMYMAHYEDVTSEDGRRKLQSLGLAPELMRISLGIEDIDAIKTAFTKGFAAMGRTQG